MSAIDEHEHERERKRALSIIPCSSISDFASGLAGLAADAQNSHDYHNQAPPLSAVSGISASVFSDLLSEAGANVGAGAGAGEGLSPEELQKEDPLAMQVWRLYARTKANMPHVQRMENLTWRMVGMALKRKLEAQKQQHYHQQHHPEQYPHEQVIQMKEEEEEHKIVLVDQLADVPERGRRTQKFGGSTTSMTTISAPTVTKVKARMRVEGFETPVDGDGDGDGCVLLLINFLHLFAVCMDGPCADVLVWCTAIVKRNLRTR